MPIARNFPSVPMGFEARVLRSVAERARARNLGAVATVCVVDCLVAEGKTLT